MRSITETQATREFVSLLRKVANGETVLVTTDDGDPVARIVPERSTVLERLTELQEKYPPDSEFGEHLEKPVREMRASAGGVREWLWYDKVILDTSVLIAVEKQELDLGSVIGHDDPAIASVTATELLVGVDKWPLKRRDERALKIEGAWRA